MKRILFAIIVLLVSQVSFAETGPNRNITNLYATDDSTTITVYGQADRYTKAFSTKFVTSESDNIVFYMTATSTTGTPNLTYTFQEGIADSTNGTTDTTYLTTDILLSAETREIPLFATVETVNGTWGRVYIKGNSGNPNDTTVTIKMIK